MLNSELACLEKWLKTRFWVKFVELVFRYKGVELNYSGQILLLLT